MKRTPEEETVRQLKILNAQKSPGGAFIRLTLWVTVPIFVFAILLRISMMFSR
jgi:hypothetical protein